MTLLYALKTYFPVQQANRLISQLEESELSGELLPFEYHAISKIVLGVIVMGAGACYWLNAKLYKTISIISAVAFIIIYFVI